MEVYHLNWRYLPYIRPIFQAHVREYPHKIWSYMKFPLTNWGVYENGYAAMPQKSRWDDVKY
jgi:hypothetical protein